eukprot:NODE_367_length_8687_cov_0.577084.p5 type:complete len:148 gc:universal NODE_367_length_8687_cov_0.577084:7701-8144(+)
MEYDTEEYWMSSSYQTRFEFYVTMACSEEGLIQRYQNEIYPKLQLALNRINNNLENDADENVQVYELTFQQFCRLSKEIIKTLSPNEGDNLNQRAKKFRANGTTKFGNVTVTRESIATAYDKQWCTVRVVELVCNEIFSERGTKVFD